MDTPFKQGRFDGLCGLYSIINSIKAITQLRENIFQDIFKICIRRIHMRWNLYRVIIDGMTISQLENLLKLCTKYISKNTRYNLYYEYITEEKVRKDGLLNIINKELESYDNVAIIIGISSADFSHWTTIVTSFNKVIKFYDSYDLKQINISNITAGVTVLDKKYYIDPKEIISIWSELK